MRRQIVGVVLVHNEDVFVEQAIGNAAAFCDRIYAADHMSTDGTWAVLERLAKEYDHVEARRVRQAGESHRLVEGYAGTDTWVFAVDGDELYDPAGLARMREELLGGAHLEVFKVAGNVLNCVELDVERGVARGYLSPPSRSITKLYNFSAIDSWTGCPERLHGGTIVVREGHRRDSCDNIGEHVSWHESPLRCLHACFLRRSSADPARASAATARPILEESGLHDRTRRGAVIRRLRRRPRPDVSDWKREKYMRGALTTVEAAPFFPGYVSAKRCSGSSESPRLAADTL
jgi:glycosyltransferase involved in cell wall biosynthesis